MPKFANKCMLAILITDYSFANLGMRGAITGCKPVEIKYAGEGCMPTTAVCCNEMKANRKVDTDLLLYSDCKQRLYKVRQKNKRSKKQEIEGLKKS